MPELEFAFEDDIEFEHAFADIFEFNLEFHFLDTLTINDDNSISMSRVSDVKNESVHG